MTDSRRATVAAIRGRLRRLVTGWFEAVRRASESRSPVALVSGAAAPVEVLRAAGIEVLLPPASTFAAGPPGSSGLGPGACTACGACAPLARDDELVARLGLVPALVVGDAVECRERARFLELAAAKANAPLVPLDVPVEGGDDHANLAYVRGQLERLVRACEGVTGRRLEARDLAAAVRESARAEAAWARIRDLGAREPSPFDAYFELMDPVCALACLRGSAELAETLEATADAYEVLAGAAQGAVSPERVRLLVEGPLLGPESRALHAALAGRGVVTVAATYSCFPGVGAGAGRKGEGALVAVARRLLRETRESRSLLEAPGELAGRLRAWRAHGLVRLEMLSCTDASTRVERPPLAPDAPALVLEGDFGAGLDARAGRALDAFLERVGPRSSRAG